MAHPHVWERHVCFLISGNSGIIISVASWKTGTESVPYDWYCPHIAVASNNLSSQINPLSVVESFLGSFVFNYLGNLLHLIHLSPCLSQMKCFQFFFFFLNRRDLKMNRKFAKKRVAITQKKAANKKRRN